MFGRVPTECVNIGLSNCEANGSAARRAGPRGRFPIKVLLTIYVFLTDVTLPTDSCDIRVSEMLLFGAGLKAETLQGIAGTRRPHAVLIDFHFFPPVLC